MLLSSSPPMAVSTFSSNKEEVESSSNECDPEHPPSTSQGPPPPHAPAAPAPSSPPPTATATASASAAVASIPTSANPNPDATSVPNLPAVAPIPPCIPSSAPSPRPRGSPPVPSFTYFPNLNFANPIYQVPDLLPPGVSAPAAMVPGMSTGAAAVLGRVPAAVPGPYVQVPNRYMVVPPPLVPLAPPAMSPPGISHYPVQYPTMANPGFPRHPPGAPISVIQQHSWPPIQGVHRLPAIIPPAVRQPFPASVPMEKPQTTIYVGKIASTVENEFMESLLRLCGPVKSWKRAVDPSDATFRGFGFCEFESVEGVLRALRLLNKFYIDGQELVLNVNQATREYLERYVKKKTEREKLKETKTRGCESENIGPLGNEKQEHTGCVAEISEDPEEPGNNEKQDNAHKIGIVTDEDQDADNDALEKLISMVLERIKTNPLLPPPLTHTASDPNESNFEALSKLRDLDSGVETTKNCSPLIVEDKIDKEMTSENKPTVYHDTPEKRSSCWARRCKRSRDRDSGGVLRWEERQREKYERELGRDRVRRGREHELKIREPEHLYKDLVKEWEMRERERENKRRKETEKEMERALERLRKIRHQEDESDEDNKREWRHISVLENRRRMQWEKDGDLADRLREEEEIAETKKRAVEDQQKEVSSFSVRVNGSEGAVVQERMHDGDDEEHPVEQPYESDSLPGKNVGDEILRNGNNNEFHVDLTSQSDNKLGYSVACRKLGFGLMASGIRRAVPSVFHEEDDVEKDKMRLLDPIDNFPEELEPDQATASGTPSNFEAAVEFAKHISRFNPEEEKFVSEEGKKRSNDKTIQSMQYRDGDLVDRRDDSRVKMHDKILEHDRDHEDNDKTCLNERFLESKQLIDTIPKTQEELFAYEIHWDVYDKHKLDERVKPYISRKIEEHFGVVEAIVVDYVVSSTKEHVQASRMLELLQSVFEDEAEVFVLRMWRRLIFEIRSVETGLSSRWKRSVSGCGGCLSLR